MNPIHLVTATILAAAASTIPAARAEAAKPLTQRQGTQQQRIAHGVRSGSLTPLEAARLEAREADLARDVARMRATGGLDTFERTVIDRRQDQLSQAIFREKHDPQRRTRR
jgi:hypothetical protein